MGSMIVAERVHDMLTADLTSEPVGARPDRFAVNGFWFSGAGLSIRSVPDAPNGLAFSSPALEIELPDSASHVRVEVWVDQAITIEALDPSGTIIPTTSSFPARSGASVANFSTRPPAIVRLRVTGGGDDSLVLSVREEP